jgi:hypothetical protein
MHPWSLAGDAPAQALRLQGFALLAPDELSAVTSVPLAAMERWRPSWERLAPDEYLRDGGRYRSRRHGCFVHDIGSGAVEMTARRPHWQSTDYNALHGGIDRWFEPLEPALVSDPAWTGLLRSLGELFAGCCDADRWYVEAHQFRIDASAGVGRPTPEGAHRDGVDYVAVIVVNRQDVKGGETRVFQADGPLGMRFVIEQPWSALLLDDARVIHESTPIQPTGPVPVRDTLVLTYRRGGFQAAG